MLSQTLTQLGQGFGVALAPQNLLWSFFGVLVGNLIGVLPGMGALSAISMLLPLTYTMHPVPAVRSARSCSTCPVTHRTP